MKSFFDLKEKSVIVPAKDVKDPTPGKKPTFKPNVSGIFEATHEEAEEHMSKAMAAHKEGNEALYNRHLSNYHDKMSEWHSERGRHGSSEKHNNLADVHHQKAIGLGEATSARMRFAAALNREQERIERERRLANPPSKPPEKEEPKKAVSEETIDRGEYDYEGQMARTQLQTIMRNSRDMIEMIKDDDNMPEWVQSKITLSHDYITTARDYLQSKQELGEDKDPCWDNYKQIGMKKKNGKQVPNCVPESYADNRRGFGKRPREDDEYHVPDTVTTDHKIAMNVSKPGTEKHSRTVTISNSTKTRDEAKATARAHLQKQGYTIHEETEQIDELKKSTLGSYVKKASNSASMRAYNAGGESARFAGEPISKRPDSYGADRKVAVKRLKGIDKATDRLTKEDTNHAIEEGIARLISKSIKRVTATKPTPQEKADIRLNK
jgi:hypothetical protein